MCKILGDRSRQRLLQASVLEAGDHFKRKITHFQLDWRASPFAEYDAQMEALADLISGITGLPLYDVR